MNEANTMADIIGPAGADWREPKKHDVGFDPARPGTDETVEAEIQRKGLTAPRVTPQDVEDNIAGEFFFTGREAAAAGYTDAIDRGEITEDAAVQEIVPHEQALGLLTFCVLVLRNGFTVTGESACASPENFDAALGRKIARQNAVAKVWPLMGYELKQRLHDGRLRVEPCEFDGLPVKHHFIDPNGEG